MQARQAGGMYLRTLRERRGLSREDIAHELGTDKTQVQRIENGTNDTRGSLLLGFVRAVQGDFGQLADLILNDDATIEDGRQLAEQWLDQQQRGLIQQRVDALPDEDLDLALQIIRQIRSRVVHGDGLGAASKDAPPRPWLKRRRRGG
jgi:transcriptional regulator with XRE-family HTH domain